MVNFNKSSRWISNGPSYWSSLSNISQCIVENSNLFGMQSIIIMLVVSERHDALYVVGSMAEKIPVRQGIYYPSDIEDTVKRACPNLVSERYPYSRSPFIRRS